MRMSIILLCVFAGVSLGGGWWIYADGVIDFHHQQPGVQYIGHWTLPGVLTTVSVIALNVGVTTQRVYNAWEARLWMFACLTTAFIGVGLSIWIMTSDTLIGKVLTWVFFY